MWANTVWGLAGFSFACLLGLLGVSDPFWRTWLIRGAISFAIASFLVFIWPFLLHLYRKWHPTLHFSPSPDMKVSDAIDYIVNDSKTIFDKPERPETPSGFPPGAKMLVVGALHTQARQKLSDKINIGEIKTWGLRQIDAHIPNQFELSLREIPASYWNDMQLDFHSALFYRGPYSQTTKIPGRTATYNWADIKVNQEQIEARWPKKSITERLYNRLCKQRTSYKSGVHQ
jgi:hypothetical protein